MRVVIAPDKFKGTLTAAQAAEAIARGWRRARPDDEVVLAPLADGGDGTLDVLDAVIDGCTRKHVEVLDARGRTVQASWLLLPDGRAVVESAQAIGLHRLSDDERDPFQTTTYGLGQLIADAAGADVRTIVVGLGGSATVDGGSGMAMALGHRLLREDGENLELGGGHLRELDRIEPADPLGVPVQAAVDVISPLLGPEGAAAVFGPQKGAAPEDVPVLEEGLERLADVAERDLDGGPWRDVPGSGAAGGLGFALVAFCGAEVIGGAPFVDDLVGFSAALGDADVIITGEGKLDAQTATGKVPAHVRDRAGERGLPVLVVAGALEEGADEGYQDTIELGPEGMERPAELVAERAEELAGRWQRSERR